MTRDPVNTTLSEYQMHLLSQIFRIIVKEITSDDDKDKLAPGELGINYKEGTFYIRNPHNGRLFSPNSLEYLKQILTKFDPGTNVLNADRVNGITVYTRLSQLDQLDLSFTPDSVIRQMKAPAFFCGPIEYENFETLGWPTAFGMCMAFKGDEEHAVIKFFDTDAYITYEGKYNRHKHLFEGWGLDGASAGDIYAETVGGGDSTSIFVDGEIKDLMVMTVRVTEDLNPGATISVNSMDPMPIVTKEGEPIPHSITENNIIMLIYDEPDSSWVLLESTESAVTSVVSILSERVETFYKSTEIRFETMTNYISEIQKECNQKLVKLEETLREEYEMKLKELDTSIANRPGKIDALVVNYTVASDDVTSIATIEGFDGSVDKLVVNYGQTMLRVGIDYVVVENGIHLINDFTLASGDVIQFIVLKQIKQSE